MSAKSDNRSRGRRGLVAGLTLAVMLVCALLVGLAVHAHLFAAPVGQLLGTSASPDRQREARTFAIWPPAGGSFVWRIEVRPLGGTDSEWRTVYLGPAGEPPTKGAPTWSGATTITAAGRAVDVTRDVYVTTWMSVGEATVAWLVTLSAALLVVVAGVTVSWLIWRLTRGGRGAQPNKRISRPTVSVVTSGRSPRRLCAVRSAEDRQGGRTGEGSRFSA